MSLLSLLKDAISPARSDDDIETKLADLERLAEEQPRRATRLLRQAAQLAARHDFPDHEAKSQYRLGMLLRTSRKTPKAEAAFARAAELWETQGKDLEAGDAYLARAGSCLMDRRVDAAHSYAEKARALYKKADVLADRPQLTRLTSAIAAMRASAGG